MGTPTRWPTGRTPAPPRRAELTRLELQWIHNEAIGIAAQFREFFPDVVRPSGCPFDHRHDPPRGALAAFMRANAS